MKRGLGLCLVGAALIILVFASAARAARVGLCCNASGDPSTDPGVPFSFKYKAAPGEVNDLLVTRNAAGDLVFTEQGSVTITPVSPCTQINIHSASCPVGVESRIELGNLDDNARLSGGVTPACSSQGTPVSIPLGADCLQVFGESGRDTLDAAGVTQRGLVLNGGDGNDTLSGGAAGDFVEGGTGADQMSGGGGEDQVDYFDHTTAVRATIDGLANDGTGGVDGGLTSGADRIATDVEDLGGGSGDDVLRGSAGSNRFIGGGGADSFRGGPGTDTVSYSDHDTPVAATLDGVANDGTPGVDGGSTSGADSIALDVEGLEGGSRNDSLVGNGRANVLTGAGGTDRLRGLAGPDFLDANDGIIDLVLCGSGVDRANVDLRDRPAGFPDCETAEQAAVDQHPAVRIRNHSLRLGEDGRGRPVVEVRLACPRALRKGCRGTLTISRLSGKPRKAGGEEYGKIGAGRSRVVSVTIRSGAARSALAKGGIDVRAKAVERDENGKPKRSLKTLKLHG